VRIELPNPGLKLKPGMFANVEFEAALHAHALRVPRGAVLTTGTRSLVFVRHDDGTLMPHEVTVGQAVGEYVQILAGLAAGQVVVASASFLVDAESNLGTAMKDMAPSPPSGAADPHAGHTMPPDTTSPHAGHTGHGGL
jgi:Cu(I)/Ag(I) efflux system membrane fusion protein